MPYYRILIILTNIYYNTYTIITEFVKFENIKKIIKLQIQNEKNNIRIRQIYFEKIQLFTPLIQYSFFNKQIIKIKYNIEMNEIKLKKKNIEKIQFCKLYTKVSTKNFPR